MPRFRPANKAELKEPYAVPGNAPVGLDPESKVIVACGIAITQ